MKDIQHNHQHTNDHHHDHDGHDHSAIEGSLFKLFLPAVISFILLILAILFDNWLPQTWFSGWVRIIWYIGAYIPVGFPLIKDAFKVFLKAMFFQSFY